MSLHISIRPQENAIVRNHLQNQVWGTEERYGGNMIAANQSFEISIIADPSQYRILVNSQHFCTFAHRLPLNLVRFVSLSGTCTISYITIDQVGGATPAFPPHHTIVAPNPGYPIHHHPHHPPAPPPMPPISMAPPPYPGSRSIF